MTTTDQTSLREYTPGASIVLRNEELWNIVRNSTQYNLNNVNDVDRKTTALQNITTNNNANLAKLLKELDTLVQVKLQTNKLQQSITSACELIETLEDTHLILRQMQIGIGFARLQQVENQKLNALVKSKTDDLAQHERAQKHEYDSKVEAERREIATIKEIERRRLEEEHRRQVEEERRLLAIKQEEERKRIEEERRLLRLKQEEERKRQEELQKQQQLQHEEYLKQKQKQEEERRRQEDIKRQQLIAKKKAEEEAKRKEEEELKKKLEQEEEDRKKAEEERIRLEKEEKERLLRENLELKEQLKKLMAEKKDQDKGEEVEENKV
ncbi:stress response protein nst1 [Acrasis kona]|uniref:Stress response protein nst1 n=1 Tax=Acrasis kona TaxID=1008807 RepID=A0AAW2Z1C4_9EUKA